MAWSKADCKQNQSTRSISGVQAESPMDAVMGSSSVDDEPMA